MLLRGVNVGGRQTLPMARLRAVLLGLGYPAVRTYLNSGNAVVTTSRRPPERVSAELEQALVDQLGLRVRCLVRTGAQLQAVTEANPFPAAVGGGGTAKLVVWFLAAAPAPQSLATHDPRRLAPAQLRLGERVIYQWCPHGVSQAPAVGVFVEKYLQVAVTARNWNTVTHLAALCRAPEGEVAED